MKIGLLSDIHGNFPALKAVVNDAIGVDLWVCAGDIIGYYPYVNDVCKLLRKIGALSIRGNHDAYVIGELDPIAKNRVAYRTDWMIKNLHKEFFKWLIGLPIEINFKWGQTKLKVRHASPWDEETYLYPDSEQLEKISLAQGEILLLGHTHHPMNIKCGDGIVVNVGSVGQPRDWNPKAAYGVLDTISSEIVFRRVSYDVDTLQIYLTKLGYDGKNISILSRGKSE